MILPDIGRDHPLRANRDFRRFVAGQFVTNAGDSLYTVAVLWLVFELSGSTTLVGVANAVLLLPWLLQAVAGPIVDRFPVKPLLVGSQIVQGVVVLVFPLAAAAGRLDVDLLLAVVPILMLATLVMGPIEATLVPRIVADDRLPQANSALATVTLGLDMLFDAVGGGLIALVGPTALFL
ncbi:MFS transporter, partial [Halolamina salina]